MAVQAERPMKAVRRPLAGSRALVETRGIEHVPEPERWGAPSRLFWLWAGAVWNVEYLVYGTLGVALFGLSFAQAVPVILVGNLFYVLTGLASLQGPVAGTTTFAVSRAPFGPRGNRVPSLFNWLTQVGFEVEGIALIVLVGLAMLAKGGVRAGDGWKAALIIGAVAVQALLPLIGHAAILKVLRSLALPFVVLFAVMAVVTVSKVDLHATHHGASWGGLFVFLAFVISVGGLGWTENGSDYSRYLPPSTSPRRIVVAVTAGAAIPSVLLEVLGAAVGTAVGPQSSPTTAIVQGLLKVFPGWFIWPYFVLAIVQLFAINSMDLYSSGVTLQSLVSRFKRVHCVMIDTVVCGGLTAYAIYSSRFSQLLADFVEFIIVWLGPWFAIYFVDYLLRAKRYDHRALLDEQGGPYFRGNGYHWPALVAQAVGMGAAILWLDAYSPYVSPLSSRVGGSSGSDFSVFLGILVGGGAYWLLARDQVRQEQATAPPA
ncbi:MAG TPA: cytosine permease [Acidimicrobiales bacterium]|nr:cytosine permease [Acidimicrobiales bacterium]